MLDRAEEADWFILGMVCGVIATVVLAILMAPAIP